MPLLDDADPFHTCRVNLDEGLKTDIIFEGIPIAQYSLAREQQALETRQQEDRKKEQRDTFGNQQDIETTISEDLADGQTTKLDASLKLLGEDELTLFLPSDVLEDDEIHVIEAPALTPADNQHNGNHALQDYQMQLMLLEQQNKRRLLMARQEQDQVDTRNPSNHQMQLMPPEQQNKKRNLMARELMSREEQDQPIRQGPYTLSPIARTTEPLLITDSSVPRSLNEIAMPPKAKKDRSKPITLLTVCCSQLKMVP